MRTVLIHGFWHLFAMNIACLLHTENHQPNTDGFRTHIKNNENAENGTLVRPN